MITRRLHIGSAAIVAFSLVESACLATTTGLLALLLNYTTAMHIIGIQTKGLGRNITLRKQSSNAELHVDIESSDLFLLLFFTAR